jgi:NADH dehydrogenase
MSQALSKIVIVGAGFGGLSAAKALAKSPVQITLIDTQNHHLFQPLLYQVATAALTPAEIAVPIRQVLRDQSNLNVVMDTVVDVNTSAKSVMTAQGQSFEYDTLILATGARHSYFGNDHWADHAPGLKTLNDASALRERILTAFEQAEILAQTDPQAAKAYQTFVVVGAGPTGVEMAGAIAELSQSLMRDFRHLSPQDNHIILLEGGPTVLSSFHPKLSDRAQRDLINLGVDVQTDTMVSDIFADKIETNKGEIHARTTVWAAGVQASPAAKWLNLQTEKGGHVSADATLRPAGFEDIYVIGDTAMFTPSPTPLPGIAPVAKQMGQYVGKRLAQIAAGKSPTKPFNYKDAGAMATIGRNRAVADIFGLKIQGFFGWILWGAAHVYFLIGFKNRLFVVLHWLWSYITWQRGVRLIMHRD